MTPKEAETAAKESLQIQSVINAQELFTAVAVILDKATEGDGSSRHLLFRGCLAQDHRLEPSVDRTDAASKKRSQTLGTEGLSYAPGEIESTPGQRWSFFLHAIASFYRLAVSCGYPLPELDKTLHQSLMSGAYLNIQTQALLENDAALQLVALAQHQGLRTPLLDWSEDPYVALYFASVLALEEIEKFQQGEDPQALQTSKGFALWFTFDNFLYDTTRTFGVMFNDGQHHAPDYPYQIHIINPPRHFNPNLAAQKGKFTLVTNPNPKPLADEVDQFFGLPAIESIWVDLVYALKSAPQANHKHLKPLLLKLTAPLSAAPATLRRLRARGYDAARLFPGLAGCVKSMEEEFLIRQAEEKLKALGITP